MKIKPATLTITIALLLTSGCGIKNKDRGFSKSDGDMKELTGMLQVIDPEKCPLVKGCGPQFSLLGRNLKLQVAIEGDFSPEHHRHILTVTGTRNPLPANLVDKSGYEKIKSIINVQKYEVRSKITYPFLVDETTKYTIANYGCDLLWDKFYSWTFEGGGPQLQIKMTNTFSNDPQPWVQLSYDGGSGKLVSVVSEPAQMNPCKL